MNMAYSELLKELSDKRIKIKVVGDKLQIIGPKDLKSMAVYNHIVRHKNNIINYMTNGIGSQPHDETPLLDEYPLSLAQEELLFLNELIPDNYMYNTPIASRIHGRVNIQQFKEAIITLGWRHSVLRTKFQMHKGNYKQVIEQKPDHFLEIESINKKSEEELLVFLNNKVWKPFNLETDSLVRYYLFSESETEHTLLIIVHHIIMDGISISILYKELQELLRRKAVGTGFSLPAQNTSFYDFVQWQNDFLSSSKGEKQKEYWLRKMSGDLPVLNLPTKDSSQKGQLLKNRKGEIVISQVHKSLLNSLRRFAQKETVFLSSVLLTAYFILLYKYSHQDDIIIGMPLSGRPSPDYEGLLGYFVNMIAVRTKLSSDYFLNDLIKTIQSDVIDAMENGNYPFPELSKSLRKIKGANSQLFRVVFAFANYVQKLTSEDYQEVKTIDDLEFSPIYNIGQCGEFDITLEIFELNDELKLLYKYDTDLFDEEMIKRFSDHYIIILKSIVSDKLQTIANVEMLSHNEKYRLIEEFNDTYKNYSKQKLIHQLFEEQTSKTPDAIAVIFDGIAITYKELNKRANKLARSIKYHGSIVGERIPTIIDRSIEMIVSVLGILKSGAAYIPLEPFLPDSRIQNILSSINLNFIVTNKVHLKKICNIVNNLNTTIKIFLIDKPSNIESNLDQYEAISIINFNEIDRNSSENLKPNITSSDLSYIIFTSGTTGKPKGVMVQHKPVINLIEWVNSTFKIDHTHKLLFITSLSFDLSVYDIFGILASGGTIRLVSSDDLKNPDKLLQIILNEKITFWDSAPAALQMLIPLISDLKGKNSESSLRLVFLSGDYVPIKMPSQIKEIFKSTEVISLGGATEATVWSNYYPIGELNPDWKTVPYGKPIQNCKYYVLDRDLNPCPIGVPGDLYIGGDCLAIGYFGDKDLSKSKFIDNPMIHGEKIYQTGDRSRWYNDGNLEFLGRNDTQVKIRGYRIELGEIENVVLRLKKIKGALSIIYDQNDQDKHICLFYIADSIIDASTIAAYLKKELPEYMVPVFIKQLKSFPITSNGKFDRKALLELRRSAIETVGNDSTMPRSEDEKKMARLWKQVLNLDSEIGIQDDFFEIGGDSLLTTKLISLVNKNFKTSIKINDLFTASTIEKLTKKLHEKKRSNKWLEPFSPVICLSQGNGDLTPFFFIHPGGGGVSQYLNISKQMKDRPIYGLKAYGLEVDTYPLESITQMASAYVEAISKIQREGPYFLGGFCIGGSIAYEMAHQFQEQGQHVALVVLIESLPHHAYATLNDENDIYLHFLIDFGNETLLTEYMDIRKINSENSISGIRCDLSVMSHQIKIETILTCLHQTGILNKNIDINFIERVFAVYKGSYNAISSYKTRSYNKPVVLFRSNLSFDTENSVLDIREDPMFNEFTQKYNNSSNLGWDRYCGESLQVLYTPGNHFSMLVHPNSDYLAEKINTCIHESIHS